jgi:hypothetical protein
MVRRTIDVALLRRRTRRKDRGSRLGRLRAGIDEYVVDAPAVAEAMVASGVFVPLEAAHLASLGVQQDETAAGGDLP